MQFTPEQLAHNTGTSAMDRQCRQWLLSLPAPERVNFLKRLWPLNFSYALLLQHAVQLSRQENQQLFRHWLRTGHHNTAQELIKRLQPLLGEETFWRIASQETLTAPMRDLMNYHSKGRLEGPRLLSLPSNSQ
ncbi:MAG: hypothetical protein K0M54_17675 [Pseudomonas sp.]|uniref:hypothetical protein n=1 Tax=Pseudomonas sp. TaxID=306 RepID=UPI0025FD72F8|nr:hypothetical protein [Pseudomonas sp.]MBW8355646.1 hypothetical protein [Pseudomonas sp.]